jgi:hypothetical protein
MEILDECFLPERPKKKINWLTICCQLPSLGFNGYGMIVHHGLLLIMNAAVFTVSILSVIFFSIKRTKT